MDHCRISTSVLTGLMGSARHQSPPDTAYGIPGQRYAQILQGTLDIVSECPIQSARRAEGIVGSQEAGVDTGEGEELSGTFTPCVDQNLNGGRSMPRKLQRKLGNARSRRESAIGTLTTFVYGNEGSAAVVGDAAVVAVEIWIGVHRDTQGLRPHDDVARLITTTTGGHRPGGKWTRTFLANMASAAGMKEDVVRDQSQPRFPAPDRDPSHLLAVGCEMMTDQDPTDVAIIPAGPGHHLLEGGVPEGGGEEGAQIVVITEQDP